MKDDYYNSGVFVPVNLEDVKKRGKIPDKSKWMSEVGFVYPGVESAADNYKHSRQPDGLRSEELRTFVSTFLKILLSFAHSFVRFREIRFIFDQYLFAPQIWLMTMDNRGLTTTATANHPKR